VGHSRGLGRVNQLLGCHAFVGIVAGIVALGHGCHHPSRLLNKQTCSSEASSTNMMQMACGNEAFWCDESV